MTQVNWINVSMQTMKNDIWKLIWFFLSFIGSSELIMVVLRWCSIHAHQYIQTSTHGQCCHCVICIPNQGAYENKTESICTYRMKREFANVLLTRLLAIICIVSCFSFWCFCDTPTKKVLQLFCSSVDSILSLKKRQCLKIIATQNNENSQ